MWLCSTELGKLDIYALSLGFQMVCLVALFVALARVKALREGVGLTVSPRERTLGVVGLAAERLADAIREAEILCSRLESLVDRGQPRTKIATDEVKAGNVGAATAPLGESSAFSFDPARPRVVSQKIREEFDVVRRLSESGASLAQICEQTGLSRSEAQFVLGVLGSKTPQRFQH